MPLARNQIFSTGAKGKKYTGIWQNYINGSENRMDGALARCSIGAHDYGWAVNKTALIDSPPFNYADGKCHAYADICPNIWEGTVASSKVNANAHFGEPTQANPDGWLFGCPESIWKDSSYDQYATGCCGG